ncbi:MAG: ABC transporter substrate-binding protein [Chloroflexi bacterium]|nr:ABC transporter substrate-binding protein [Chloroflexota bacterium]
MFSRRTVVFSFLLALFLISTTGVLAQDAPITVTDALGREVTFAQAPQRIVMTGRALFMAANAVYMFPEAESRVVAIGRTSQMALDFIPAIDPTYGDKIVLDGQAGAEEIAASQPDLVLLKSSNAETLGAPLDALGIPVVYVDFETPEQYVRDLTNVGLLLQNEARAEELVAFFQDRTDRITEATAGLTAEDKPSVLVLYYSDRDGVVAFNVPPTTFIQTWAIEAAGGAPVWLDAELGRSWTTVTLEQIAAWDPDQIYVIAYLRPAAEVIAMIQEDAQWQALRAVEEGQIYGFPADYYSWDQPDPRWILGLTWLAKTIQPDLFADLDMEAEIRSFYSELYGLDDSAYDELVAPYVAGALP